jgi:polysaccharide export outer membrane protein
MLTLNASIPQPRRPRLLFAFLALCVLVAPALPLASAFAQAPAAPAAEAAETHSALSSYRVGPGDVITVRVVGEDDLSVNKARLTDAGTVSFPALGEIQVRGLTIGELEALVISRLKGRILVNPQVLVQVDEYRPFFITGMVNSPGSIVYRPGLDVGRAATLAGGFHERASLRKIFIVREGRASGERERANLDTPVYPGDMIVVEESFF